MASAEPTNSTSNAGFGQLDSSLVAPAQRLVLDGIALGLTIREACQRGTISRATLMHWLEISPTFKQLYDHAWLDGGDVLEAEARRRAAEGVLEPVYYQGKICGRVRKYSDTLLAKMLEARRPEYRRQTVEHTGEAGQPIQIVTYAGKRGDE